MKYTIVTRQDEKSNSLEQYIHSKLANSHMDKDDVNPKIIIVIGGDGTFLIAEIGRASCRERV